MLNSQWLLGAVAALAVAAGAHAQTYRWVDANGRVHYSDVPPPPSAAQVETKKLSSNIVGGDLPYQVAEAMKNFPVTLYVAPECGEPCAKGRAMLGKRGVPFREVSVGDAESRKALKDASGGESVPVLAVGRDTRVGYEEGAWQAALDGAGYPRSAPSGGWKAPAEKATPKSPAKEETTPVGPYTPKF